MFELAEEMGPASKAADFAALDRRPPRGVGFLLALVAWFNVDCTGRLIEGYGSTGSSPISTGTGGSSTGAVPKPDSGPVSSCAGEPDGTACVLWWEPCVNDAACESGQCRSALAEAEVPGQLRWEAGLTDLRGPQTVDDGGRSTFLADFPLSDGGSSFQAVYAFDACGKMLWIDHDYEFYGAMSDGSQVIAWGATFGLFVGRQYHLVGLAPTTGDVLWDTNLSTLISGHGGEPAGTAFPSIFDPAMSGGGVISVPVSYDADEGDILGAQLLSLDREGQPAGWAILPADISGDPVVDAAGQLYIVGSSNQSGTSTWTLWSDSSSGSELFYIQSPSIMGQLAAGADGVSVQGFGDVGPDGGVLYSFPLPISQELCGGSELIDATGTVYEVELLDGGTEPVVVALSPTGEVKWLMQANALPILALSDNGTLFSLSTAPCDSSDPDRPPVLTAMDADAGTVLWQVQVSDGSADLASLALTPGATLLTCDDSNIYAVFAGQERPSTTAPWSRDRGGNGNQASASAP